MDHPPPTWPKHTHITHPHTQCRFFLASLSHAVLGLGGFCGTGWGSNARLRISQCSCVSALLVAFAWQAWNLVQLWMSDVHFAIFFGWAALPVTFMGLGAVSRGGMHALASAVGGWGTEIPTGMGTHLVWKQRSCDPWADARRLDRPSPIHVATIADTKALVDDPAAFTEEMQSHRVIAQIIKPARKRDAPSSNSDLFLLNLFSFRILPRCRQALVGCKSMNATLSDGTTMCNGHPTCIGSGRFPHASFSVQCISCSTMRAWVCKSCSLVTPARISVCCKEA